MTFIRLTICGCPDEILYVNADRIIALQGRDDVDNPETLVIASDGSNRGPICVNQTPQEIITMIENEIRRQRRAGLR